MCLDLSYFTALVNSISVQDVLVPTLVFVGAIILFSVIDALSEPRPSRTLRRYRHDVDQLQQAVQRERRAAANECLDDVYRLIRKR